MKRLMLLLSIFGIAVFAFGQKPPEYDDQLKGMYKNTVELITVNELYVEKNANSGLVLLDAREINEFKVCHIEGARCIGYNNFSIEVMENIPKDSEIVIYCSLGVRSEHIGEQLKEAGYKNVKNLYGGIFEWKYKDQVVVDKKGNPTEKVHAYDENWSKWLLKGEKVY
jgi:rhodanese-related sulfurtransferase